ncbi:DUF448 domain-containing protein [Novosphingobium lentum]|uniref:DUF448 domain-containing protein n=1 Tax=Novosphingobium lentum TaxID=145287 RepID=UPI000A010764|nr:DUF448 domain-containing protein [Novosphingobium lentum]
MRNPRNEPLGSDITGLPAAGASPAEGGAVSGEVRHPSAREVAAAKDAADPERKCVLSGEHGSRDALIRLALSPDGVVAPDVLARAPGRGAWIGVSRADLEKALANGKLRGAMARAFKGAALTLPDDLPARTEAALLRALTDRLGIELRSGNVLLGTEKIAQGARSGAVRFLGHASDASDDGSRKLAQAWRVGRDAEGSGLSGTILPLDRAALSVALGRDNVVHLALTDAAAARRVAVPLERLLRFIGRVPDAGPGREATDTSTPADAAGVTNDDIDTKDAWVR